MPISGMFVLLKHTLNLREDAKAQTVKTDQRANLLWRKQEKWLRLQSELDLSLPLHPNNI